MQSDRISHLHPPHVASAGGPERRAISLLIADASFSSGVGTSFHPMKPLLSFALHGQPVFSIGPYFEPTADDREDAGDALVSLCSGS